MGYTFFPPVNVRGKPSGWGQFWYPRLQAAKAGGPPATVAFLGTSVTQGYYASNPRSASAVARVRSALQSYAGAGGSGFYGMPWSDTFMSGAPSAVYNAWKTAGVPWAQTGSWSTPTFEFGPALGILEGQPGATITTQFTGSLVDLWFFNAFAGSVQSFTYSIDGGAVTGTVTSNASYGPDFSAQFQTVSAGGPGSHTITLTAGANGTRIVGLRGRNSGGVIVDNFGIAGMQSRGWSNRDDQNSGTYMGGWRLPADLIVLDFPYNDVIKARQEFGGTTTTSGSATIGNGLFRNADIGRLVSGAGIPLGARIDTVNPGASATLDRQATATGTITATITDPDPVGRWVSYTQTYLDGALDDIYAGNGKSGAVELAFSAGPMRSTSDPLRLRADFMRAMYGLADVYGAAVADVNAARRRSWIHAQQQGLMGNPSNPALAGADEVHPSDAGHQAMADSLLKVLLP